MERSVFMPRLAPKRNGSDAKFYWYLWTEFEKHLPNPTVSIMYNAASSRSHLIQNLPHLQVKGHSSVTHAVESLIIGVISITTCGSTLEWSPSNARFVTRTSLVRPVYVITWKYTPEQEDALGPLALKDRITAVNLTSWTAQNRTLVTRFVLTKFG